MRQMRVLSKNGTGMNFSDISNPARNDGNDNSMWVSDPGLVNTGISWKLIMGFFSEMKSNGGQVSLITCLPLMREVLNIVSWAQ